MMARLSCAVGRMFRKVVSRVVDDLDAVASVAAEADRRLILIFDTDNTIVPQGTPPKEFRDRVNQAIDRFEQIPTVERAIVLTNGPRRGVDRMISRGNKPWTSRKRLGLVDGNTEMWVIGDQVLTDGVLAWRLGAEFFHCMIDPADDYPGQARLRRLGRLVAPLIFRR